MIDLEKYQLSADGQSYELKPEILEQYRRTNLEQLDSWVAGTPIHNTFMDECCPDFSCCGGTLWPEHKRLAFKAAGDDERSMMLMGALGDLCAAQGVEVYVTGADDFDPDRTIN